MNSLLSEYLDKIINQSKTVDSRGVMQVNRMIDIELNDIFIELNLKLHRDRFAKGQDIKTLTLEEVSKIWLGDPKDTPSVIRSLEEKVERNEPAYLSGSDSYDIIKLDDIWNRNSCWVLLGDPGAGKTTVLKYLTLTNAEKCTSSDKDNYVPLPLTLRDFGHEYDRNPKWKSNDALLNFLCGPLLEEMDFAASARNELREYFENVLKEGKAVLLLDGLDEQRDTAAKLRTSDAIEALLNRFPHNRCIVTSRIIGYDLASLGSGFSTATLEPFDDGQMKRFFEKWFIAIERSEDIVNDEATTNRAIKKAAELLKQLGNNDRVQRLAVNPLLCSIIGLIFRQGGDTLPAQRGELYKLCIDTFIFNWEHHKTRKGVERVSLDKDETQSALEAIAIYLQENAIYTASRPALSDVVSSFLKDELGYEQAQAQSKAERLLDLVRDVAGLLIERGDDTYAFFHLTFQEYLVARAITRKRRLIDHYLGRYLFNPRWREVIRLAAIHQGMKDEESGSDFIAAVLRHPHQREAEMQYAFRIALQCATEARVELKTSDSLVKKLIDLYLHRPELANLLYQGDIHRLRCFVETLQPLIAALRDESWEVSWTAQKVLVMIEAQESIAPLIAELYDEYGHMRHSTAEVLEKIKRPETLVPFVIALRDGNVEERRSAARRLGRIKAFEAVVPLIAALQDVNENVRKAAAGSLGEINVPEVIMPLIDALQDEDGDVRWVAIEALGKIKALEAVAPIISLLRDASWNVRLSAAEALGAIKVPEAVAPLIAVLSDENENVRRIAVEALRKIKAQQAVTPLITTLRDSSQAVRRCAAEALGVIKSPEAVAPLINTFQDKSEEVRRATAMALGAIKAPETVAPLIAALQDENKPINIRETAAKALGVIKAPEAVTPLINMLQDKSEKIRGAAAIALGDIKAPEAVAPLIAILRDEDKFVRLDAINALGGYKAPEALASLIATLSDEDAYVRRGVVAALEKFNAPEVISPLIAALRDEDDLVRWTAVRALGKLKAQEAAEPLVAALKDEYKEVRSSAAEALGALNIPESVAALLGVMTNHNEDVEVRRVAARSIKRIDMGDDQ